MKIGFSGASGSGKTTIVKQLKELLSEDFNVVAINEVARSVFLEFNETYGYQNLTEIRNSEHYLSFQKRILDEQIYWERKYQKEYNIVLCDRTIYDILLYVLLYGKPRDIRRFLCYFEYRCEAHEPYDKIFLLEYLKGVDVDDGFRTPDIEYRNAQELILKNLLREVEYVYIPQSSVEQRLALILLELGL